MQKILIFLSLTLALTACAPSASPAPAPTAASTPTMALPRKKSTPAPQSCGALSTLPTPDAAVESLFSPVDENDMVLGSEDAATTFIVYLDYQDSASAVFYPVLEELREKYPQELRIVYRDFPMVTNPGHEKAGFAAHAVHAADLQGKFLDIQALLFEQQEIWAPLTEATFINWLAEEARKKGIDSEKLLADMQDEDIVAHIRQAFIDGQEIGIPFTPFLLINGQIHDNLLDFNTLDTIVGLYALEEKQFKNCPPQVIDPSKEYLATLETEKGEIIIRLYSQEAPYTVNNFIFLAEEGWYEGITFHRVLPEYFAETGDPSGTGYGHPGYFFENEISSTLFFDRPGVVAMKNVGEGTNGSLFFITYDAIPAYDGKFTVFGQVLSGMEVLETLTPRDPQFGETLPLGDTLIRVTIEER